LVSIFAFPNGSNLYYYVEAVSFEARAATAEAKVETARAKAAAAEDKVGLHPCTRSCTR
jgi:hypothetical protein